MIPYALHLYPSGVVTDPGTGIVQVTSPLIWLESSDYAVAICTIVPYTIVISEKLSLGLAERILQ